MHHAGRRPSVEPASKARSSPLAGPAGGDGRSWTRRSEGADATALLVDAA